MDPHWGFGGFCDAIHSLTGAMIPCQQRKPQRQWLWSGLTQGRRVSKVQEFGKRFGAKAAGARELIFNIDASAI
jgi:hypothetical protein